MHCCGNPLHDIPANLPFILPMLAPLFIWWRAYRAKTHTHTKDCNH